MPVSRTSSKPALMLPGGGARGAYQVGVLKALAEQLTSGPLPFPLVAGTSAGAINAAVVASHANDFGYGVSRLERFWSNLRCRDVYKTGWLHNLARGLHWMASMTLGGLGVANPRSLLDNQPLARLLQRELRLSGVARSIEEGWLEGLMVTASGYSTARACTFFQASADHSGWRKGKRQGVPSTITVDHLLASAALPILFPARRIGHEFFGDGGMRHTAPMSPPIRLGADRLLIIGTRDELPDPEPKVDAAYPTLGHIGGYLLDVIFMDYVGNDLERLERINRTLGRLAPADQTALDLRPVRSLQIQPSSDLRSISERHLHRVPRSVRFLLKGVGAWGPGRLPSYLLFDQAFCRELIELGHADGAASADEVGRFLAD